MSTRAIKQVQKRIPDDVAEILKGAEIDGNVLRLPGQLSRDLYAKVDKALKGLGGKWDRRQGGHVFPFPASELVAEAASTGTFVDRKQTLQFFETPEALAARLVAAAGIVPGDHVLEPSAGHGRLIAALPDSIAITAVEIDEQHCDVLRQRFHADKRVRIHQGDFLDFSGSLNSGGFNAVVMNPPFTRGQDMAHVLHAFSLLKPGGRLAAIVSEGPFIRSDQASASFRDWLASVGGTAESLPVDTFKESGTRVATRLIVATASADQHQ